MDAVLSSSLAKARFTMLLVAAFAAAALLLGAVGIYGVMSYIVGQRTQEMGVRLALGAPAFGVIALVVGRAARLALAGAAVGLLAALLGTRSLGALLYGISATDPLTFVAVPVVFLGVAVLASYGPALRATRVDPVRALRTDG
jgi:ABC-type antimicrobial peptide transport system permease subunit